MPVIR